MLHGRSSARSCMRHTVGQSLTGAAGTLVTLRVLSGSGKAIPGPDLQVEAGTTEQRLSMDSLGKPLGIGGPGVSGLRIKPKLYFTGNAPGQCVSLSLEP